MRPLVISLTVSLLSLAYPSAAFCQTSEYKEAKSLALRQPLQTKRDWHVTAYQAEGEDAETGEQPVKICFWSDPARKDEDCKEVISAADDGSTTYPHQTLQALSIASLRRSDPALKGIMSVARFSGGGSGSVDDLTIWTYDREDDSFTDILSIRLNELSEYKVVDSGPLGGTVVTATGLWQSDEGHFGEHRFWVQVYQYTSYYKRYVKMLGFTTQKKYPSENIGVIDREMGNLERLWRFAFSDQNAAP